MTPNERMLVEALRRFLDPTRPCDLLAVEDDSDEEADRMIVVRTCGGCRQCQARAAIKKAGDHAAH